jgi:hypothetical protein
MYQSLHNFRLTHGATCAPGATQLKPKNDKRKTETQTEELSGGRASSYFNVVARPLGRLWLWFRF